MVDKELPKGIAVVTGAAGGMGSATARQLAEAGWKELLLCDVDAGRLEAVSAPLRAAGAKVEILAADVSAPTFSEQLLAALGDRPIGALVHTAGISPVMATSERILAVNLGATTRLVDTIRERMAPGSAAVLFASNSAYFPMLSPEAVAAFNQPLPPEGTAALVHLAQGPDIAYLLSKLGVRALAKREAKSFGQRGVRLVSVSPGAIDTPMLRQEMARGDEVRHMIEASASGRAGRADEVAAVAVFLCSPAASFVTAVDWLVDGGHLAAMEELLSQAAKAGAV